MASSTSLAYYETKNFDTLKILSENILSFSRLTLYYFSTKLLQASRRIARINTEPHQVDSRRSRAKEAQ